MKKQIPNKRTEGISRRKEINKMEVSNLLEPEFKVICYMDAHHHKK